MISRVDAGVIVTGAILSSERVAGEVATVLVKGVNEFDEPPTEAEVGVDAELLVCPLNPEDQAAKKAMLKQTMRGGNVFMLRIF
jgi:hypothetical protein